MLFEVKTTTAPFSRRSRRILEVKKILFGFDFYRAIHQASFLLEDYFMDTLTERENEVALLVSEGLRNRGIAERLCVAVKTVENHLTSIYGKVGVKSRARLICFMLEPPRHSLNDEKRIKR